MSSKDGSIANRTTNMHSAATATEKVTNRTLSITPPVKPKQPQMYLYQQISISPTTPTYIEVQQ